MPRPRVTNLQRLGRVGLALVVVMAPLGVAFAHTETLDFKRKDKQFRGPEDFTWGALARDRRELRKVWDRYDLRGDLPAIGFKKNVAVVAGTGGSSSCPLQLHDLRLDHDRERVIARMYLDGGDGACTDDWRTTTFTVSVARADLRPSQARDLTVRPRRIEDPDQ